MHNDRKRTIYAEGWSERLKCIAAVVLALMLMTPVNAICGKGGGGGGGGQGGAGSGGGGSSHSSDHGDTSGDDGHGSTGHDTSASSESHGDSTSTGGSGGHSGYSGSGKRSGSGSQAGAGESSGSGSAGNNGSSGGKGRDTSSLSDDDSDSDRPEWAMGNKEENPHIGDANPTPGVRKGDEYGDLYVVVRDPVTGEPILDDGELQICTTADCTEWVSTVDGEVPEGVTPIEVDFGRLNIGRSPTKVIEHALDEALSKITAEGAVVTLDPAGRIIVDGATIDSPLENLALYLGIMDGDQRVLNALDEFFDDDLLEMAPALLGAAASKTGEIKVDLVYYSNLIYDLAQSDNPYDYVEEEFTYNRDIYDVVDYFYMDGDAVSVAKVNLQEYLEATQPTLVGASGITLFSIAADDALEIVELTHTQIHDAELPGTVPVE